MTLNAIYLQHLSAATHGQHCRTPNQGPYPGLRFKGVMYPPVPRGLPQSLRPIPNRSPTVL